MIGDVSTSLMFIWDVAKFVWIWAAARNFLHTDEKIPQKYHAPLEMQNSSDLAHFKLKKYI